MALAAIAALSSCSREKIFEQNEKKQGLVFIATIEDNEATRATYNTTDKCAAWEIGDRISINGATYSASFYDGKAGTAYEECSVFFPAAGLIWGNGDFGKDGIVAGYWSSTPQRDSADPSARCLRSNRPFLYHSI